MQNPYAPIAQIYQAQLEASREFTNAIFSGTEKIDQVLLNATHRALAEQLEFARSLSQVRDPGGIANAQATFLSHRPEQAIDYQREMLGIITEMQNEIGKSMRRCVDQLGHTAIDSAASAQTETQPTVQSLPDPVAGMFSVWESAFRQAASLANRNMAAARGTVENIADNPYASAAAVGEAFVRETSTAHARKAAAGSKRK